MPDWSRRTLLRTGALAGVLGAGWYVAERPHCRPTLDPWWTYHGEHWGPVVTTERSLFLAEGYGVTGGSRFRLVALDPYYGQAQWATAVEGGGFGVPSIHEDRVYVGTGIDTVRALDVETGQTEWAYDAGGVEAYGGGAWGRPLVAEGSVFVGVSHADDPDADPSKESEYTHRVVALDTETGVEQWSTAVTTETFAGPVHAADTVVSGSVDGVLRGFDPETGEVRWAFSLPGGLRHRPLVHDETLTLVTTDGTVELVDVADGTTRRTKKPLRGATAVDDDGDTLYLGGESGRVVALSFTPSADLMRWPVEWEYEAGVRVGGIAAGEAGVFVIDQSGDLHRLTDHGQRKRRVRVIDSQYADQCGWTPDHHLVAGAVLRGNALFVSSEWWVRAFDVNEV